MSDEGERPATPAGRDLVWWGWGSAEHPRALPPGAPALLASELGELEPWPAATAVELPPRRPVGALAGVAEIRADEDTRRDHAAGKSYPDLVRMRSGRPDRAPDAVVAPASRAQVAAVLRTCADAGIAVVPFGGGTSVVGGLDPLDGGHHAVVALDLGALDRLRSVDPRSQVAVLEAGLRLPEAEALLGRHGLTLGHYPQSYEYATVGGCVVTRSAGQASTGYGRIDELVAGLRAVAPAGELDLPALPPNAAGPDLREVLMGSEGTLAVVTEAALRVRPRPDHSRHEGWSFPTWDDGLEAFRALEQRNIAPDVARLSDPDETRITLAQAGDGLGVRALGAYRALRGHTGGCLAVTSWDGDGESIARRHAWAAELLARHGGVALGGRPGRAWAHGRFDGPYLRDALLDAGVMTETLETATTWTALPGLHTAVREALHAALSARGTPPIVMCHVSHLYPIGASLYFTFLARREPGAELEQWRAAKCAAGDAIVAAGGSITHHHAVGTDHRPWMEDEVGATGLALLRAAKCELDPSGILNPGKLLPSVELR